MSDLAEEGEEKGGKENGERRQEEKMVTLTFHHRNDGVETTGASVGGRGKDSLPG